MPQFFDKLYYLVLHYADQLSPQQWVIVLAVMIIFGFLCMRGYGSRSNY